MKKKRSKAFDGMMIAFIILFVLGTYLFVKGILTYEMLPHWQGVYRVS